MSGEPLSLLPAPTESPSAWMGQEFFSITSHAERWIKTVCLLELAHTLSLTHTHSSLLFTPLISCQITIFNDMQQFKGGPKEQNGSGKGDEEAR